MSRKRPIEDRERVAHELTQNLGPEFISYKPGGAGGGYAYLDGGRAIQIANEVFGFDGWSSQVMSNEVDFCEGSNGRWEISVTSTVRVTLSNPSRTFHEGIGSGAYQNARSKADAYEKGRKEAFTDGLKRALLQFGEVTGNCLRDKNYLKQVRSMNSVAIKYDPEDLRRPVPRPRELVENIYPEGPKMSSRNPSMVSEATNTDSTRSETRIATASAVPPAANRNSTESAMEPPKHTSAAPKRAQAELSTPARKVSASGRDGYEDSSESEDEFITGKSARPNEKSTTTKANAAAPEADDAKENKGPEPLAMFVSAENAEVYQSTNGRPPKAARYDVNYRSPMHTNLPQDRSERILRSASSKSPNPNRSRPNSSFGASPKPVTAEGATSGKTTTASRT